MSNDNLTMNQIIDLLEGRLGHDEAERVLTRIRGDEQYAALYRFASEFLATASRTTLQPVPASTRAMLEGLMPERRGLARTLADKARVVAQLVVNTRPGTALAGARGVQAVHRQLVFAAAAHDVVIDMATTRDGLQLSGQVLGNASVASVRITSEHSVAALETDEFGEFSAVVSPTSYLHLEVEIDAAVAAIDLTPFLDHDQGALE